MAESKYTSYNGVMHLQKEVLGIGVHEADGRYGPDADVRYQAWLAGQFAAGKTEEQALTAAGMSRRSIADIQRAIGEYRALLATDAAVRAEADAKAAAAGVVAGGIGAGVGGPVVGNGAKLKEEAEEEGWPAWKWLLLGAGVAGAGVLAWYLIKQGKEAAPARGAAGLGDEGGPGDLGCMCGTPRQRSGKR